MGCGRFRPFLVVAGEFSACGWRRGSLFGWWWLLFLLENKDILMEDKDYFIALLLLRFSSQLVHFVFDWFQRKIR